MTDEWNEEDLNILKEHYTSKGSKYVAELVNRSRAAVMTKAAKLGLRMAPLWSENDIRFLKRYYKNKGPNVRFKKIE